MIMNPSTIKDVVIDGHSLTIESFVAVARFGAKVSVAKEALDAMQKSRDLAEKIASEKRVAYGITTGFGDFARVAVPEEMSSTLSTNLILSHCTATGEPYSEEVVRGMLLLRANALCGGVSGVRPVLVTMMLVNNELGTVLPVKEASRSIKRSGCPALLHCDASYVRRSLQQCGNACGLPAGLLSARSLRQTRILELVRQGLPAPVADMFAGRNRRQQSGSIRYNLKAAQTLLREHVQRTSGLRTSARNVFHGRIEHLRASGIIVTVVLCTAGGLRVTAMITDESCKSLGLSKDMLVTASIKAPWIIIEPDQGQDKPPVATRNCFRGTVERVRQDEMLAEILVNLPDGSQACALHVRGESPIPPVGSSVWVIFKALSVILTLD